MNMRLHYCLKTVLLGSIAVNSPTSLAQCIGGTCGIMPRTPDARAEYVAAPEGVVRLSNRIGQFTSHATGVLAAVQGDEGLVLSVEHLFRDGSGELSVTFRSGQTRCARLLCADPTWDLSAVLVPLPSEAPRIIQLANESPRPDESAISGGYGQQGVYRQVRGAVQGYAETGATGHWQTLVVAGDSRQGDSGGPVFNAHGQLAGILWGTDGDNVYATCSPRLRTFLDEAMRRWSERRRVLGEEAANASGVAEEQPAPTLPPRTPLLDKAPTSPAIPRDADASDEQSLDAVASLAVRWGVPTLLTALGWTGPPAVATVMVLRLLQARRRRRRRTSPTCNPRLPICDEYATELADLYELSGRSTAVDALLGRTYDEELQSAETCSDPTVAKFAKSVRSRVAKTANRVCSEHPPPTEPIGDE